MKIELNKNLYDKLFMIYQEMFTKRVITTTNYFPFLVCFPYIDESGNEVDETLEEKRLRVCRSFNKYIERDKGGSFTNLLCFFADLLISMRAELVKQGVKFEG